MQSFGFDGIALGMMGGLAAANNIRTDEYGGSLENRCRMTFEFCEEVKKACGKGFIVHAMINGVPAEEDKRPEDLDKGFKVLSGNDSLILKSLQAGGAGGIAGCSNVYPHVLSSIYNLFVEGKIEEAQAAQNSIASFRAVFKYGNPNTVVKKAAALLGNPVGECRRPFSYLSEEGTEALRKVLEENKAKGMA